MAATLTQFLQSLSDSGLLSADEVSALRLKIPPNLASQDAQELSRELVQQGKLTKFQASALYDAIRQRLVLGDYVILDMIGSGGMGQVFKAQHRRMDRVVALKLLPAEMTTDTESIRRFQREVKAVARLKHDNIVSALDAREEAGVHYLVMEYIEGCNLWDLVKNHGRLTVQHAVGCTTQVARGLEHAHAQGIIHRDIKPLNLVIDRNGTVKILDMGLARLTQARSVGDEADGLTATGQVMGTIDFMSPEQALEARQADQRADIYSLGCTLFYLLTGKRLYEGNTVMKVLLAHREAPLPSLCRVRSDVPEIVDFVFQMMVAKRPEDRYQTMSEVLEALQCCSPTAENSLGKTVQLILGGQAHADGSDEPVTSAGPAQDSADGLLAAAEMPTDKTSSASASPGRTGKWSGRRRIVVASLFGALALAGAIAAVTYRRNQQQVIGVDVESTLSTPAPIVAGRQLLLADQAKQERAVAEFVLRLGGKVHVATATATTVVEQAGQLPVEPLLVTAVLLNNNPQVTDNDLSRIGALSAITGLELGDTHITDAGLEKLSELRSLQTLRLTRTKITDRGVMCVSRLENLAEVYLNGTDISSASLLCFRGPKLKTLALNDTLINDDGLGSLAKLSGLESLNLSGTGISDTGIAQLRGCPVLFLTLRHVKIGRSGLSALHDLPHLLELNLDDTNVTDQDLEALSSPRLQLIRLIGTKVTPAGLQALKTTMPYCTLVTQ